MPEPFIPAPEPTGPLPPPVFHDPKHHIKIYQGDCLEILAAIPEGCVDLIFADPPYLARENLPASQEFGGVVHSRQMPDCNVPNGRDRAPILRWAGSKRSLVPLLRTYWNKNHRRYLEPFAGSACLFFSLNPTRAILGDVNHELIATYLEVKYRVDGVIRELAKLCPSREQYNTLRALSPCRLDAS